MRAPLPPPVPSSAPFQHKGAYGGRRGKGAKTKLKKNKKSSFEKKADVSGILNEALELWVLPGTSRKANTRAPVYWLFPCSHCNMASKWNKALSQNSAELAQKRGDFYFYFFYFFQGREQIVAFRKETLLPPVNLKNRVKPLAYPTLSLWESCGEGDPNRTIQ